MMNFLVGTSSLLVFAAGSAAAPPTWDFSGLGETHLIAGNTNGSGRGEVHVYHDSSATPLFSIRSPARRDLFGVANASAGDLDGDGFDDLLIGAPLAGQGIKNHGAVYVYSSATGAELLMVPGFGQKSYFGRAVAGAGDVNGDGVPDLLAAGWIHTEFGVPYGRVYLMSGVDGRVLRTITSFEDEDGFGYTIASMGDLTGDGVPEIGVAAPLAVTNQLGDGAVYIFDLTASPVMHITTADAWHTITNGSLSRDYFGSVLAYDDLQSTPSYHSVLVGSVDPISYGSPTAQFIFSRHKIAAGQEAQTLSESSTPSQVAGDAIPDGKVTASDVSAVVGSMGGSGNTDLDGDGQVTSGDMAIVLTSYGTSSPVQSLLSDPSPVVSRMAELTSGSGGLNVQPGSNQPWTDFQDCNDDNDDSDDTDDNDDDDTDDIDDGGPSVQPPMPGVRPGTWGGPRTAASPPGDDSDSGDCDDDDDDDDGGCSGCDIPDGAGDDADCDAISDTATAAFVGRGLESDSFYASVTSNAWILSLQSASGDVGATITQGAVSSNGVDYHASVQFDDTAGESKLKWVATNADTGVVVTQCFSVQVVDYTPVRFRYQMFIPCGAVATPRIFGIQFPLLPPFFGGDIQRFSCDTNAAIFGMMPNQTHRSSCDVYIGSDGIVSSRDDITVLDCDDDPANYTDGEIADLGIYPRFGLTRAFAATDVTGACNSPGGLVRCDYELAEGAEPLPDPAPASRQHAPLAWVKYYGQTGNCQVQEIAQQGLADGANGGYALRVSPNKVFFRYYLHASDPLIPLDLAPAIDVFGILLELTWQVRESDGRQEVLWVFHGEADPFPAHQAYIEDERMWAFDPVTFGLGVFALGPQAANIRVSTNGSIEP
ncbi:MAG: hypothetical protein D6692_05280 [Planctomycetota bacterium]|nr:MAG: hypothetical protein D6692_05280 [Planctomycetota bacterium]